MTMLTLIPYRFVRATTHLWSSSFWRKYSMSWLRITKRVRGMSCCGPPFMTLVRESVRFRDRLWRFYQCSLQSHRCDTLSLLPALTEGIQILYKHLHIIKAVLQSIIRCVECRVDSRSQSPFSGCCWDGPHQSHECRIFAWLLSPLCLFALF